MYALIKMYLFVMYIIVENTCGVIMIGKHFTLYTLYNHMFVSII